ncbi:hypothetical protein [Modestobacter sp. Leaf380]|uniref:hypothetical protein n=1 Tax=Modestobacter sp. Leaf380 TaxID=1736356 RepID=UPI00070199B9|nr:hypothetical protein [Modestobacter sp. Leaf380]KQS68322.1 hypothetical protein ASG41_04770 [Modestobacter sp. Leaf380]
MSALRLVGWAVLAVLAAAWLAAVEVFWLPLRVGPVPVPLSLLVAAVGNLLLPAWVHRHSGSRVVALLPVLVWVVVAIGASVRRPEGDLLITGQTTAAQLVGLGFLLVGVLAGSFSVGRVLSRPVPRPAPVPAGSGSGGAR